MTYGVRPQGYRLPDNTRVGAVRLQVAQLQRSLDYYESVVGLTRLAVAEGTATLGAPDGTVLVHLVEKVGARPVPRRGRFGLYHFAILLPDRPSLGRLVSHLSTVDEEVGMADHLVSEALYLTDPDGLGIEVYADRPRSSWRTKGSELAMASDRLDVRALTEAGGTVPWAGVPAGTVMGHVHLHVGSLAQAEAFYHSKLGFDKTVWSYPGALFLSAGGYHHHLATNTWSPGPGPTEEEAQLLEWSLVLPTQDDVAAAAAAVGRGGDRIADPWGTLVRLTSSS